MKYIITETQKSRLHNLILNMYKDMDRSSIKKLLGVSYEVISDALIDEPIPLVEDNICDDLYSELFVFLQAAKKLKKEHEFSDGSKLLLFYESLSGTLQFEYSKSNSMLDGYATPFYESCVIPIVANEITYKGRTDDDIYDWDSIDLDDYIHNISTFRDLLNFFNEDYPKLIKPKLDKMTENLIKGM